MANLRTNLICTRGIVCIITIMAWLKNIPHITLIPLCRHALVPQHSRDMRSVTLASSIELYFYHIIILNILSYNHIQTVV